MGNALATRATRGSPSSSREFGVLQKTSSSESVLSTTVKQSVDNSTASPSESPSPQSPQAGSPFPTQDGETTASSVPSVALPNSINADIPTTNKATDVPSSSAPNAAAPATPAAPSAAAPLDPSEPSDRPPPLGTEVASGRAEVQ